MKASIPDPLMHGAPRAVLLAFKGSTAAQMDEFDLVRFCIAERSHSTGGVPMVVSNRRDEDGFDTCLRKFLNDFSSSFGTQGDSSILPARPRMVCCRQSIRRVWITVNVDDSHGYTSGVVCSLTKNPPLSGGLQQRLV